MHFVAEMLKSFLKSVSESELLGAVRESRHTKFEFHSMA